MHIFDSNVKGVGRGVDYILAYIIKRFSDANLIELELMD